MFARLGAKVVDADRIVHDLIEAKGRCFKKVVRHFGKEILDSPRGGVDRRKLGEIVFHDQKRLKELEQILHPQVIREIKRQITHYRNAAKSKVLILDVPLLFESGLDRAVDMTIVVKAAQREQIFRSAQRLGLDKKQALRRIQAQMPLKEKILLSDIVIDNGGSIIKTRQQVKEIWESLI